MCLAIPARVIAIETESDMATVAVGELHKQISLVLVTDVQVDDYVLVHVGYALNKIDANEARKTLALFTEAGVLKDGA